MKPMSNYEALCVAAEMAALQYDVVLTKEQSQVRDIFRKKMAAQLYDNMRSACTDDKQYAAAVAANDKYNAAAASFAKKCIIAARTADNADKARVVADQARRAADTAMRAASKAQKIMDAAKTKKLIMLWGDKAPALLF